MKSLLIFLSSAATVFAFSASITVPQNIAACGTYNLALDGFAPLTIQVIRTPDNAVLETFTNINADQFEWHVTEPANTPVYLSIIPPSMSGESPGASSSFTIQPSDSVSPVPQKTLPGPGQCLSGDTGAALTSDSSCASLTADGSTIYVGSSTNACCDSIPAGTFVCTTPATPSTPSCDLVPTNAAASTSCLASESSVTLSAATTCDFLTSLRGTTTPDYYTTSGSDICCDSIPAGTIICVPTSSSSTSTCPTTTAPPTNTATQTTTGTTTTTTAPPSGPSGYVGCYEDSIDARVLPNQIGISQVTIELCVSACSSAGFQYAGLEWSQECWCGNSAPTTLATDGRCDMTCAGNSQEICGGGNGLSVYTTGSSSPSVLQSYNYWTYTGCYEDSVAARTMPTTITTIDTNSMTVEKCLDACNALGHSYAGLEWSQECYCADALPPTQATDGQCNMACKGNGLEICGGGNGLTVYTYSYSPPHYTRRAF